MDFETACNYGSIPHIRRALNRNTISKHEINRALISAVAQDRSEIVFWLIQNAGADINCERNAPFVQACMTNNLNLAKKLYLYDRMDIFKDDSFGIACLYIDLEFVKWYYAQREDREIDLESPLVSACSVNNIETAQWLHNHLGGRFISIHRALQITAKHGHLESFIWLAGTYPEELETVLETIVKVATDEQQTKILKWLATKGFKLSAGLPNCD